MSSMWANNVKSKKTSKMWHQRALMIDTRKTRLVIESADVNPECAPLLTRSELVKIRQVPSCVDKAQPSVAVWDMQSELVETDQVPSSIDKSPISLAIQDFQFSVTYYSDPLEEQGKRWFGLQWLEQAFSDICAVLG